MLWCSRNRSRIEFFSSFSKCTFFYVITEQNTRMDGHFFFSVLTSSTYLTWNRIINKKWHCYIEKKIKSKVRHQNQICSIAVRERVMLFLFFMILFCVRDTNGTYCLMHKYVLWLDVFNTWNWSILLLKIFEIDIRTINVK